MHLNYLDIPKQWLIGLRKKMNIEKIFLKGREIRLPPERIYVQN